jgi:hypothetical protein
LSGGTTHSLICVGLKVRRCDEVVVVAVAEWAVDELPTGFFDGNFFSG